MGVVAFCLMVAALGYLFFGDTAVAQMWRLPRARRHQDLIARALEPDPRYAQVKVGVYTTNGGGNLMVSGVVACDEDLEALKAIVASSRPPTHVQYRIQVRSRKGD